MRAPRPPLADRWWPALHRLGGAALDFLLPPRCAVCGRDGALLCDACLGEFVVTTGPRCPRCWTPGAGISCARCNALPPDFRTLRTAFVFTDPMRAAIHRIKYDGLTAVVEPLVELVDLNALPSSLELVTPVPMAGRRRRQRGHNQAEVFARALAGCLGLPVDPRALRRRRSTPQQAQQLNLEARRANVQGAFSGAAGRVAGRRILVVDDVTTSGATLDASAAALLEAGAASVDAWALARED